MAVAGAPIEFYRGSSLTIEVLVKDKVTGLPLDLTDGRILFTLKRSLAASVDLVRKTSDIATEAVLLAQAGNTLGKAQIFIIPVDTATAMPAFDYVYDVWFEPDGGGSYAVVKPSQWDMKQAATEDFS